MTLPKVIKVLGQDVALKCLPESKLPDCYGQWKFKERRIELRTKMSRFDTMDTLLHELFHAILTHQAREYSEEMEEHFVNSLAHGLTTVLKDNPDLRLWIEDTTRRMGGPT